MRGSFFEFYVATSGLFTSKGALNVVSHNIANAAVQGYAREYAELRATQPLSLGTGKGMIGTGSEMYGVSQIRDFYLDKKYWNYTGTLGQYTAKRSHLALTETIFDPMADSGLKAQLDELFNRISDLTTNASDNTYRMNVLQQADTITTNLKNTYESLSNQQRDINNEVYSTVQTINSIGRQIAALDKQIKTSEMDGSSANDLRDARALLVDQLSQYVNVQVSEVENNDAYAAGMYPDPEQRSKSDKEYIVTINGNAFVTGNNVRTLECVERKITDGSATTDVYANPEDITGLYDIYWADSNTKFDIYNPNLSGSLKGLIDVRDGNGGNYASSNDFAVDSSNPGQMTLNLTAGSRIDLLDGGGGILKLTNKTTGVATEIKFASMSVDYANNSVTLTLPTGTTFANTINSAGYTAAIGQTTTYKGIPYYLSKINEFARTFANALDFGTDMKGQQLTGVTGHVYGYDANGNNTGALFYTYIDSTGKQAVYDPNDPASFNIYNITGKNLAVNSDLMSNPSLMACASRSIDPNGGVSENGVAQGFWSLYNNKSLFMEGNIVDYINGMSGELGIDLQQAQNFENNYTDVTQTVQNQRLSVMGVDLQEETVNMIKLQQQFNASAKLMNVIDQIYGVLINSVGNV